MSRPLVILRPEPGCSETLAAARVRGLDALGAPLFAIESVAWTPPDLAGIDALLIGSANAFRHGGNELKAFRDLPVWAVGKRTAAAAREAGFAVSRVGSEALQGLLGEAVAPKKFLRLAGEAHVALHPPPGVTLVERIVYRAVPLQLAEKAAQTLRGGAVAAVHSAEAARHFADECERLSIPRAGISIAALGPRIADAIGENWMSVRVAKKTTDCALLALLADMCH